jgi:16S rRNA C967 or C1407 C5-methylase (RsmB/RsmF family)/NOL1/NOP2/fmu family ribosome biogenesis protein
MIPEAFKKRIQTQKYIDSESLLKSLEEPSPVSIMINPSKWDRKPSGSETVPWCSNGFYLQSRPSYTLDPLFHSGCYYPREASGMFLGQVFRQIPDLPEDLRVLDLCAAPGGKSIHLYDLIGTDSFLVSNDAIRQRSVVLAETITKWGSANILVTQNDPSAFGRLSGFFDIIVVDAPCSGEGMFRSNIAREEWSEVNALHSAERQKRILMDVWPALKENGVLVYSTCTFNFGENEENLKWLIDNRKAEIIKFDISEFGGVTEIDFEGVFGYGFYPGRIRGEGFFISAVRKTGNAESTAIKKQRRPDLQPGKNEVFVADEWANFRRDRLFRWGDELFAAPCDMDVYLFLFNNLKVVRAGQKIFAIKNKSYLPQHELALSGSLKKDAFPVVEISLQEALAFMRRDNFKPAQSEMGWNILRYEGSSVGFINNIGNRVNNYFPVEWRIRMDLPDSGKENIIKWEEIH